MNPLKPALQSSSGRSKPWSGARLVNCFAEMSDGDKTEDFAVMAVPGLDLFASAGAGGVRGLRRMGDLLYAVIGPQLYSITSAGTATPLGTIEGSDPVRIVDNGSQLAIVGGVANRTGYVYSGGTLYTGIANLPEVIDVEYIDGYFVWIAADTDQFVISGLDNGLIYDPTEVGTVEGSPDPLVAVVANQRELLFFGRDTTEVWHNSGAADFPFERQGNAFIERGCIDRNSIAKLDNTVYFVSDDRMVRRMNGYTPERVSSHAVEYALARATWFRAFSYTQEGHTFYVLNMDVGSWVYDLATGAWAERESWQRDQYRGACSAIAFGKTIIGDGAQGKLYVPNLDSHTEDGDPIPVTIDLPTITTSRQRATMYGLELYCETGVGNDAVADPQVIMQYSRDGGRTWSLEMWRSMGQVGQYLTRAVWRPNVEFRQLQVRFKMPEKARRMVLGYYADVR